jgi:site-specific DNA recombinase
MIFDWYINGNEHGKMMSLVAIAEQLTRMGIATPAEGKKWVGKYINNRGWHDEGVWKIIVSETYCGTLRYGKRIGRAGRNGTRPIDEQIAVNVPAIVSRETWELAQARRAYNSRIARRNMKHEFMLRSLIFCGCGRRMTGSGRTFHYYCPRRYPGSVAAGRELCTEPVVKGRLIEAITWDYIMGLITDPVQFEQKLKQAQAQEAATMQPKQKELEHVIALLLDTEKEAEEIALAARRVKGIVGERLEKQADEINKRYQALTARKIKLQEALAVELTENTIDNLLQFRETVALGLEHPTFEDKRRWLEILQTKVTVTNRIAVITCRLGGNLEYNLFELRTSNG